LFVTTERNHNDTVSHSKLQVCLCCRRPSHLILTFHLPCTIVGNKRFKICIENYLRSHTKAATRSAKSAVISDIVSSIRESSAQEGGGFVRFDASHCLWYEVGDKVARDKVGQALRDSTRANTKEVREKKSEPCPSSQALVQCAFRPKEEKMELFELSAIEHSDKSNNVFYATTSMATEQTDGKLPKHSTSTVTLGSGSDGLTMLLHEIAMDGKPFILTKDNCTDAWPAQTDNIIEWFENDMQ
jgi:hypothetical protein